MHLSELRPAFLTFILVLVSSAIAVFAIRLLSPAIASLTIDLYYREYIKLALFGLVTVGSSWILASGFKLSAVQKKRTIFFGIIVASVPLILWFSHVPPLNRAAQKRTMADIRRISQLFESYRARTGNYPIANNMEILKKRLGVEIPINDEWNRPLSISSGKFGYVIVSYGADSIRDQNQKLGPTFEYASDIILENGVFVSYPEGIQK